MANNHNFVVKNGLSVGGQTVITSSRQLTNITSVDSTTIETLSAAGLGGGSGNTAPTSSEDAIAFAIALG